MKVTSQPASQDALSLLVKDIKNLRESGIATAQLSRLPQLEEALTLYFPGVRVENLRGRIQELLKAATATMGEDQGKAVELALGLDSTTDLLNSKARRAAFADFLRSTPGTVRRPGHLEDIVFGQLGEAIQALVRTTKPREPGSDGPSGDLSVRPQDDLFIGRLGTEQFRTSHSPAAYRELIGALEADATHIDAFPKRLSVVFKGDTAIRRIAEQRFGRGSSMLEPYVEEHLLRRKTFYANLERGTRVREIYVASDLREYLLHGKHGRGVDLLPEDLEESVSLWRTCLQAFPENYIVAFTDERIPFKYEVIDSRAVVMHEAISGNDRDRLNAFAIENEEIARHFARDFGLVWERTPAGNRSLERTLTFIDEINQMRRK